MIHNFYIVKKNGICVFHKKFGSLEEEPQSITGFLTAISMFSNAIIGEDIKILATNKFKFIFKTDDKFTFITFDPQLTILNNKDFYFSGDIGGLLQSNAIVIHQISWEHI